MANDTRARRLSRLVALIVTACIGVLTSSVPTAAADRGSPSGDGGSAVASPEAEVKGTASDREVVEASVASLQADRAAVRSQLAEAKATRDRQFDRWALTHLAAQAAQETVKKSSDAAAHARRQVVVAQERVREYAMDAFMNPPAMESMAVLAVGDAERASRAHHLMSITADDKGRVVEELSAAQEAAQRAAAVAQEAAATAAEKETASRTELDALEASVRTQERLAAQIDQRLDSALAEAAALREVDESAAQEMEAEEVALAEDSKAALEQGAASRAPETQGTSTGGSHERSGGGGGGASQSKSASKPKPEPPAPKPSNPMPKPPTGTVGWDDVTKVGTFWVHRSIASNVQGLLSAASAAGFNLSGGGFRDPASQISLRRAHCGPSYYDIYQRPASQCSPPTAIPGRSMHEQGRALDIKSGGALITSRSSAAFKWLAANAAAYGFYNLPSEPWHWSTNGT